MRHRGLHCLVLGVLLLALPLSSQDDPCKNLLSKWNWTVESEREVTTMQLPKDLKGIPFYHYQAASLEAGLDLTPGLGQEVSLRRFVLEKKGTETGAKIFAQVALLDGKVLGAWLSTDAPIAPGITSLKNHHFGQGL